VVSTPGVATGSMTRQNAPGPLPSALAASPSSAGSALKYATRNQMESGSAKRRSGTSIARRLPETSRTAERTSGGATAASGGSRPIASTSVRKVPPGRKPRRAMA
jgi:hypothetical protein